MNITANSASANPLNYWQNRYKANQSEKFTVSGTDTKNRERIQAVGNERVRAQLLALSESDDHEKVNAAMKAYTSMQATLMQRITQEKSKIKAYNELDGKINYYTDLLRQCRADDQLYVDDLKYDLQGTKPRLVARSEIESYLEQSKDSFDRLVNWEPYKCNDAESNAKCNEIKKIVNKAHACDFAISAAIFATATGIASDWLDISDDESMFSYHEGITKENFVETAEKKIEKLKARSNGLADLMEEYKKKLEEKGLINEIDFNENYKFKFIETIRQEFLRTGKFNDAERTYSLLNALA